MRNIGSLDRDSLARNFSLFLEKEGIGNTVDVKMDPQAEVFTYQIWIHNEEDIDRAKEFLEKFQEAPPPLVIDPPKEAPKEISLPKKGSFLTMFFLGICTFIYLLNFMQESYIAKKEGRKVVLVTPIQIALLYDTPYLLIDLNEFIKHHAIDPSKDLSEQPSDVQTELKKLEDQPYWNGIYDIIVRKIQNKKITTDFHLFEKISQGEVWRLFTPCILHTAFLHLLFNMLWLIVLGKMMESRIGIFRMLLFIVIVAIITNTSQYLMSGPYFLGFSGVVMGMVGFIWMRQKKAPWEGYPLQKSIILFLVIFILAMLGLSLFSFIMEIIGHGGLSANIANTAHLVGGVVGALLGKMRLFSEEGV